MSRRRLGWLLRKLANRLDPPKPKPEPPLWSSYPTTSTSTGNVTVTYRGTLNG